MYQVEIVTPEKKVFNGEAKQLLAPGKNGLFCILTDHAPFISSLATGPLRIDLKDGTSRTFNVSGGFLEADNNKVMVLADKVEVL